VGAGDAHAARLGVVSEAASACVPVHPSAMRVERDRSDGAMPYGRGMAKAARILAALKRDGWIEARR
jgi:hypothetical protein